MGNYAKTRFYLFKVYTILGNFADVAQLVEQRFRKAQVVGSSPIIGSSFACILAETGAKLNNFSLFLLFCSQRSGAEFGDKEILARLSV